MPTGALHVFSTMLMRLHLDERPELAVVVFEADGVTMVDTMRDVVYDAARVQQKFGVPPAQVRDWLALRGDSTDNIPGVAGIGEVTATKLLTDFGTIEGIVANLDKLKGKLA